MSFRNRRRKENPKTHPLESESGAPRDYRPFIVRATRQDPPSGKREWGTQRLPPIFRPGHPPTPINVHYFMLRLVSIPAGATLIGVHPGARIAVRRWGDERFAEVAEQLLKDADVLPH